MSSVTAVIGIMAAWKILPIMIGGAHSIRSYFPFTQSLSAKLYTLRSSTFPFPFVHTRRMSDKPKTEQKTYHKRATGAALTTVKKHAKDHDFKLIGSCFWWECCPPTTIVLVANPICPPVLSFRESGYHLRLRISAINTSRSILTRSLTGFWKSIREAWFRR